MAILPRYKRLRRRDWKDPFSWFNWYFIATARYALASITRLAEDTTVRLAEDGTVRITE